MGAKPRQLQTDRVGLALAHDSAALHVQGTAIYIDDMREPVGTLHVEPGYAKEEASGRITGLNLDAVRSFPGGVGVLTEARGVLNHTLEREQVQAGRRVAAPEREQGGKLCRKAGVMAVGLTGGELFDGAGQGVALPPPPHQPLEPI